MLRGRSGLDYRRAARRLLLCCVWIGLLAVARPARADTTEASRTKSRELFVAGAEALERGEPSRALPKFREAYRLYPHYATLYNIVLAHRDLGEDRNMAEALDDLESRHASDLPEREREVIASLKEQVDRTFGRLRVRTVPASATIRIDGRQETRRDLRLSRGPHELIAEAPGHARGVRSVRIEPGVHTTVVLTLSAEKSPGVPPGPVEPSPPPTTSDKKLGPTFWIAAGVGGAALAVGTVTGILALGESARYEDPATPEPDATRARSRGLALRTTADVAFGVAAISGVIAIVAVLRSGSKGATTGQPKATQAGLQADAAGLSLRF